MTYYSTSTGGDIFTQQMNSYYLVANNTTTSTNYTINYKPYTTYNYDYGNLNYVYSDSLMWKFTPNIQGLREYMFANTLYNVISDILLDESELSEDEQYFEDKSYRFALDLLYEFADKDIFIDILDEKQYPRKELDAIINEILDEYHNKKSVENETDEEKVWLI